MPITSNNYQSYIDTTAGNNGMVFDVANSLEANNTKNNVVFYFEIPVNDGEYAMGMVEGSTSKQQGAYMFYLDIGANGDTVDSDIVKAHSITTIKSGNSYPVGIDFSTSTAINNGGDSLGVFITSSSKGTITFSVAQDGTSITMSALDGTSQVGEYAFKGAGFTATGLSGDPPNVSEGGTRTLYISLVNDDTNYSIEVIDYLSKTGTFNENESIYKINGSNSTKQAVSELSVDINIDSLRELVVAATIERDNEATTPYSTTAEFVVTYDEENSSYNDQKIDIDIERNGTRIHIISITDEYSLYISGTQYNEGDYYPA